MIDRPVDADHSAAAPAIRRGLLDPAAIDAVLFDLGGVVTDTATVHAEAWAALFDRVLGALPEAAGQPPFDPTKEYVAHDALRARGADLVVGDPGDNPIAPAGGADIFTQLEPLLDGRRVAVFLDFDGTLTPIVARPDLATLSDTMRGTLRHLAARCPVAVISGRDRVDVAARVGLDGLVYAGSHGFDIELPDGTMFQHPEGATYADAVAAAADEIRPVARVVEGAIVEAKRYAVAVHYRQVAPVDVPRLEAAVDAAVTAHPDLRKTGGKMVFELRPRLDWDKGRAVIWLIGALDLDGPDLLPIYIGDDITDEDVFVALAGRGLGIRVGGPQDATRAQLRLSDVAAVGRFLDALGGYLAERG